MIEVINLYYKYSEKDVEALKNINFTIKRGEFVCIVGKNGSGKSTLAKHLNALLIPQKGAVLIDGWNTKDDSLLFKIRQKVGLVFQNPDNQIVATTVEDDIAFALENLGVPRDEMRKRVDATLKLVGLYEKRETHPHFLSGGQKQRLAIGSVLIMEPDILVLDEPTAMLDITTRLELLKFIEELNKNKKITVVLITHHMDDVLLLADRVIVMDNGEIVFNGKTDELFLNNSFLKKFGLELPFIFKLKERLKAENIFIKSDNLESLVEELCCLILKS